MSSCPCGVSGWMLIRRHLVVMIAKGRRTDPGLKSRIVNDPASGVKVRRGHANGLDSWAGDFAESLY